MPVLICKRVIYFSDGDEKAFFDWLNRIKVVRKWHGVGESLFLQVPRRVSASGYRELDALFRRYKIDRAQLGQLSSKAAPRDSDAFDAVPHGEQSVRRRSTAAPVRR
jgi:hypothetical protein